MILANRVEHGMAPLIVLESGVGQRLLNSMSDRERVVSTRPVPNKGKLKERRLEIKRPVVHPWGIAYFMAEMCQSGPALGDSPRAS